MRCSISTAYHYPLRPGQGLKIFPKIFPGEHSRPESRQGKGRGLLPPNGGSGGLSLTRAKGKGSGTSNRLLRSRGAVGNGLAADQWDGAHEACQNSSEWQRRNVYAILSTG
jgi:hypothetical protein